MPGRFTLFQCQEAWLCLRKVLAAAVAEKGRPCTVPTQTREASSGISGSIGPAGQSVARQHP